MNLKDILIMYLLIILVILTNIGGALLYKYYVHEFANFFKTMLAFIGIGFTIMQFIVIGNFCHKAFKDYFRW